MQTALQEVPLRQVHLRRDEPQVGDDQRGEANPIQKIFQEERRNGGINVNNNVKNDVNYEKDEVKNNVTIDV
jgi:hypothetical protein